MTRQTSVPTEPVVPDEPLWESVYMNLRGQIERKELAVGDRMPAERHLGCSRGTASKAMLRLEREGFIEDLKGSRGRVVIPRMRIEFDMSKFELGAFVDDPATGVDQWQASAESSGWTPRQIVVDVSERSATPEVVKYLGLDHPEPRAVRRRRLRLISRPQDGIKEKVAMIADTWTPPDIAYQLLDGRAPLMSQESVTLPGGIYHSLGYRQTRFLDSIEVRMATSEEAQLLSITTDSAVGQHVRVGIDDSGRRVRALIHVWAGDRQVITYDLPVPERRLPAGGDK